MKIIIFALLCLGLCDARAEITPEALLETANLECINLGGEALAIQAIRYEIPNITIDELITGLDTLIKQEFPEGARSQPLFLSRVRAVAKWVFFHYPNDFDENLVGQTYTIDCQKKTFKQLADNIPKRAGEGSKESQKRKALQAGKETEILF